MSMRGPLSPQAERHHITGFSAHRRPPNHIHGHSRASTDIAIHRELKFLIRGHVDIPLGDGIPSLIPWEHRKVLLRTESIDRLADIRSAVRDRVALRHPPVNNLRDDAKLEGQRERLRRRAEREVLSALVRHILSRATTGELARALFL